ncbi:MAG: 2TM domain-containing protein [Ignavibacteria bacterium]|nr:2TM domain-containing protein [Ignavibacteria bacterium]
MDTENINNSQIRDEKLWKLAKKRAEFKKHLITYAFVNLFLWGVWLFSSYKRGDYSFPWPAIVTFSWGIGIGFNYISAYTGYKDTMTQNEYNKLVNKK